MSRDILDEIDAVLVAGEPAPPPDVCPRCGMDWHAMPLTVKVLRMKHLDGYDPDYSVKDDDSRVLCLPLGEVGPALIAVQPEGHLVAAGIVAVDIAVIAGLMRNRDRLAHRAHVLAVAEAAVTAMRSRGIPMLAAARW